MVNYDGLFNKDYFGDKLNENHLSDKKLHFRIVENGMLLPHQNGVHNGFGGILDSNGTFIDGTNYSIYGGGFYRTDEEIKYSPQTVIYAGMFTNEWGHCITDSLRRLWFFKKEIYKKYFKVSEKYFA